MIGERRHDEVAEPRDIIPADLLAALAADDVAWPTFEALPPSHRREYVEWICSARRAATRERRIAAAVDRLRAHAGARPASRH